MGWLDIKPFDWLAAFLVIVLFVYSFFLTQVVQEDNLYVHIYSADSEYIFPLHEERTLTINGPYGITTVQIAEESVRVIDSPGRKKICVQQGAIDSAGKWLICLPNKVFIRILGGLAQVDAHSY